MLHASSLASRTSTLRGHGRGGLLPHVLASWLSSLQLCVVARYPEPFSVPPIFSPINLHSSSTR